MDPTDEDDSKLVSPEPKRLKLNEPTAPVTQGGNTEFDPIASTNPHHASNQSICEQSFKSNEPKRFDEDEDLSRKTPAKEPKKPDSEALESQTPVLPSKELKKADHETLWNTLGFTDEKDSKDFHSCWENVKRLKYNDPSLKMFMFPADDPVFPKDAWIRLGWYLSKNDFIECLKFEKCNYVTDNVIEQMFGSVVWSHDTGMRFVSFKGCSFGLNGAKCIVPFLKASVHLVSLIMVGVRLHSGGFKLIIDAVSGGAINVLSFSDCKITNMSNVKFNFPQLRAFEMCKNKVGCDGADCIANSTLLKLSSQFTILNLRRCGIGDRGAESISKALASNTTLKKLFLCYNPISVVGVASFSTALFSNHFLRIFDVAKTATPTGLRNEANIATAKEYKDLKMWMMLNNKFEGKMAQAEEFKKAIATIYPTEEVVPGLKCAVCHELKSDFFVFTPCRHKICADCHPKFRKQKNCHTCRQKITRRNELF